MLNSGYFITILNKSLGKTLTSPLPQKRQSHTPVVSDQTAELGAAAPDIIFLENFCTPELHNIYVVQYIYCSMAIAR